MAKIVLGLGTSHTPMLLASDATLERFVETDQKIKHRDKEGRPITYGELLEKADPKLADMVAPAHLVARQNVARDAIKHLQQTLANTTLDALIVFGDDQNESYKEDCRPAFAIYYGDTIRNSNEQHEEYRKRFPGVVRAEPAGLLRGRTRRATIRCIGKLATHLIETLMDAGFDLAASQRLPEGEGEGHAIAYVHRRVMDANKPVPAVPVFLNTYFPPNQPRPRRCYEFGQAMRKAVEAFPGDARVGVLASGGLISFPRRRGFRPRHPQSLRRQGRGVPADRCRATSSTPAARKSSTGWRSPARSSTSISTGSNTCRAIAPRPAPARA